MFRRLLSRWPRMARMPQASKAVWGQAKPYMPYVSGAIVLSAISMRPLSCDTTTPTTILFPPLEPYNSGHLQVSPVHTLYYEECGNPKGKPVVLVHGGPGAGCSPSMRQFHDPEKYRIILFDQRGAGKSTPHASLEDNTTWHLVQDMETLRQHLNVDTWQVFGGSWGSTLSLAYAQKHPSRVTELILRGIFHLRQKELAFYYQHGANMLFPDRFQTYQDAIPEAERGDYISAYRKRLLSSDATIRKAAAVAWTTWEKETSQLKPTTISKAEKTSKSYGHFAEAFARIENHYFYHRGFFPTDSYLLDHVNTIQHIPTVIVQGRYDVVCPMATAYELSRALPHADFQVIATAGHSALEPGIAAALVQATNRFASI